MYRVGYFPYTYVSSTAFYFFMFQQGAGGSFTHFYPGTHHAVDLECPEGTPVLAMASGVAKEVRQANTAGGIHARGLFDWNSVRICTTMKWADIGDRTVVVR